MRNLIKIMLLTILIFPLPADGLSKGETLFRKAMAGESSYHSAASEFALMIDEKSADPGALHYNLANALYLDGDPIAALTAYSAALSFSPGNSDYIGNRDLVLLELELPVPVPSGTEYIFHAPLMVLGLAGTGILILIILITALLSGILLLSTRLEIFRTISIVLLFFASICSISFFTWEYRNSDSGIVKSENTVLRQGDSPLYNGISDLPPGTELRVLEEREGWYRIKTMRTQTTQSIEGWLKSSEIMTITELIESLN